MAKRAYVWRQSWSPEAGHAWRFFGEVTPQKDSKGSGFGVSSSEPERKDHRGGVLPSLRPLRLALKNPAPLPLFFNGSFLIHNSTQPSAQLPSSPSRRTFSRRTRSSRADTSPMLASSASISPRPDLLRACWWCWPHSAVDRRDSWSPSKELSFVRRDRFSARYKNPVLL